jgi:Gpi18-like mannosyltransferase
MRIEFDRRMVKDVLNSFFSSRLMILLAGVLSSLIIKKAAVRLHSALDLFYRWDSGWYRQIALRGYYFEPGKESSVNFFPLYPLLVRIFSLGLFDEKIVGFIISNVALLLAAFYLYKLVKIDHGDTNLPSRTVFYFLICPVSFFFSIFYTEGLFLFVSIAAVYYARQKNWPAASVFGFFAATTRNMGVFVIIPLLLEYFEVSFHSFKIDTKKIRRSLLWLALVPAGLGIYMVYLQVRFGDAIAFLHASKGWHRRLVSIFKTLSDLRHYSLFYRIIFCGAILAALVLIALSIKYRIRISYISYSVVFLLVYLSSNNLESIPRFISVIFPLYLGIALFENKHSRMSYILTLISTMLLTLFTILFTNGYWFT